MVVLPIRSFRSGKTRLGALDDALRIRLLRSWAEQVLAAAHDLEVIVVSDDAEVARWAGDRGLTTTAAPVAGLNAAATHGRATAAARGATRVLVAHADLPHAQDLRPPFEVDADVVAVSDRHRDGTNVLVLPAAGAFTFAYGPGSFDRHRAEASRQGLRFAEHAAPDLSFDIDGPDDLALLDTTTGRSR